MDMLREVRTGENVAPKLTYLVLRAKIGDANPGKNH